MLQKRWHRHVCTVDHHHEHDDGCARPIVAWYVSWLRDLLTRSWRNCAAQGWLDCTRSARIGGVTKHLTSALTRNRQSRQVCIPIIVPIHLDNANAKQTIRSASMDHLPCTCDSVPCEKQSKKRTKIRSRRKSTSDGHCECILFIVCE